jgi:hypothetical protein
MLMVEELGDTPTPKGAVMPATSVQRSKWEFWFILM